MKSTRTGLPRVALALALMSLLYPAITSADLFKQAGSAAAMRLAEGQVYDVSEFDPEPHWAFSGSWRMSCGSAGCGNAQPEDVDFDLALIMVRPDGGLSHAHAFSDFVATSVIVDDDNLFIEGTIVGTGGVGGLTDIAIDIIAVSGAADVRLEFPGNTHLVGVLGGVAVRSR